VILASSAGNVPDDSVIGSRPIEKQRSGIVEAGNNFALKKSDIR
jgi:hypothetical protein